MTLEEYNTRLRELAELTERPLTERVIVVAATRMLATMHNRIFRDGLDSSGGKIGSYSTKPMYATKDQFIKKSAFRPIGKGGKDANIRSRSTSLMTKKTTTKVVKKDGKERKSMYLPDGYKEFREIQGRPTAEVNFQMRGDLKLSYVLQAKEQEVLIGFNSEKQAFKRKGLEEKFKGKTDTIFPAMSEEKELYSTEVIAELNTVHNDIMKGLS